MSVLVQYRIQQNRPPFGLDLTVKREVYSDMATKYESACAEALVRLVQNSIDLDRGGGTTVHISLADPEGGAE